MPMKDKWIQLGMKRAIQMAVNGGFNRISWTNSADQINRWGHGSHEEMFVNLYDKKMVGYAKRLANKYNSKIGKGLGMDFDNTISNRFNKETRYYLEISPKMKEVAEQGRFPAYAVPAAPVAMTQGESDDTTNFIKSFEGYKGVGYYATKSEQLEDLVTVGYGSTKRVKIGEKISKEQAEQWFKEDLTVAEKAVDKLVKVDLNNNQRVAIVSLIFNIGEGNFKKSKALKALNEGDFDMFIEEAFDSKKGFVKSGNRILKGLVKRRQAEKKLFQGVSS